MSYHSRCSCVGLFSLGFKFYNISARFYERCEGFSAVRTMSKCTSRHLFSYGGLALLTFDSK